MKCTTYETCAKLHRFHILYIARGWTFLRLAHITPSGLRASCFISHMRNSKWVRGFLWRQCSGETMGRHNQSKVFGESLKVYYRRRWAKGETVEVTYLPSDPLYVHLFPEIRQKLELRPEFFISWFAGICFSDLGAGDEIKSSVNDKLTGHFQSFFFLFFNISRKK